MHQSTLVLSPLKRFFLHVLWPSKSVASSRLMTQCRSDIPPPTSFASSPSPTGHYRMERWWCLPRSVCVCMCGWVGGWVCAHTNLRKVVHISVSWENKINTSLIIKKKMRQIYLLRLRIGCQYSLPHCNSVSRFLSRNISVLVITNMSRFIDILYVLSF